MADDTLDVPALQRLLQQAAEELDPINDPEHCDSCQRRHNEASRLRALASRLPAIVEADKALDKIAALDSKDHDRDSCMTTAYRWEGMKWGEFPGDWIRTDDVTDILRAARSIPAGTSEP